MRQIRFRTGPVLLAGLIGLAVGGALFLHQEAAHDTMDSGGILLPEQAAFDVGYYELDIELFPESREIEGRLTVEVTAVDTMSVLLMDLDSVLSVHGVYRSEDDGAPAESLAFQHRDDGRLRIELGRRASAGDRVRVGIAYGGAPRVAAWPPWSGGFTWSETPSGAPWIATSNQNEGADLWWPVKDHPSDEPDSFALHVTVPESLTVASNGRLRGTSSPAPGKKTFHWFVSTPINNYTVALNVAPYAAVDTVYMSTAGDSIPVTFWVYPEAVAQAREVLPEFLDHMAFLEGLLGPYPFRADKYGIAQTPFLGMEHQTIIAYGNEFGNNSVFGYDQGFDALHFHELAHEWFGNLITARDWKDFWLHEGFASYMEALYAEHLHGTEAGQEVVNHFIGQIQNSAPVAYKSNQPTSHVDGNDIYFKGAAILHTLRFTIGDEAFFTALRRFVYPTEASEAWTDGRQCRFVTTADFLQAAEAASGLELDGFFETYLYHAQVPSLDVQPSDGGITLSWVAPGSAPFELPVEIRDDNGTRRVTVTRTPAHHPIAGEVVIDPHSKILAQRP